jgi:hypothetical protein
MRLLSGDQTEATSRHPHPGAVDQVSGGRSATPEERLACAVLEDALRIVTKPGVSHGRGRYLRGETEAWLLSEDTAWPFSFLNVCSALALDPGWLRKSLRTRPGTRNAQSAA